MKKVEKINKTILIIIIIFIIVLLILLVVLIFSNKKTSIPNNLQTIQPTTQPTIQPTIQPTTQPTTQPTIQPTTEPTIPPIINSEYLKKLFNNTDTNLNNIGGLLAKNFIFDSFQTFLDKGDIELIDTGDCASVNRHTCAAYTYIRKDLLSMLFTYPTTNKYYFTPCGIIFDVKKIWSLLTLMANIDADTNARNCLTNESGYSLLIYDPYSSKTNVNSCIKKTLQQKYGNKYLNYAVYTPSINPGGSCPVSCNNDLACMYNNSGGNINMWYMLNNTNLCQNGYSDCFDYTPVNSSKVPSDIKNNFSFFQQPSGYLLQTIKKDCPFTKKPYLFVLDEYQEDNKYDIVVEDNRIAVYIGKDGNGFQKIIADLPDPRKIAIKQARFEKKDWNSWIKILKKYYQSWLDLMNQDNSMKNSIYNYILGNPENPSFLENEVNVYIDPNVNNQEYLRQNKIFQDSIIGFYYIGTDCEEQMKDLKGVKSVYNSTYTSNIDRCNGFYGMSTNSRRSFEKNNTKKARNLVLQVAKMFNKKHDKNIPVFKCSADSCMYPNYESIEKALKGETNFDDIFQEEIKKD